jgi:hypothetical protein
MLAPSPNPSAVAHHRPCGGHAAHQQRTAAFARSGGRRRVQALGARSGRAPGAWPTKRWLPLSPERSESPGTRSQTMEASGSGASPEQRRRPYQSSSGPRARVVYRRCSDSSKTVAPTLTADTPARVGTRERRGVRLTPPSPGTSSGWPWDASHPRTHWSKVRSPWCPVERLAGCGLAAWAQAWSGLHRATPGTRRR